MGLNGQCTEQQDRFFFNFKLLMALFITLKRMSRKRDFQRNESQFVQSAFQHESLIEGL